jgi:hypothetical protein
MPGCNFPLISSHKLHLGTGLQMPSQVVLLAVFTGLRLAVGVFM